MGETNQPEQKPEPQVVQTTWRDRLKAEAKELKDRNDILTAFLESEQLKEIPVSQRSLLKSQHTYQTLLLHVLEQRIEAA